MICKNNTKANNQKAKRKFHITLLLVLCLCYNMSIARGNDLNEKNPSFDLTSKVKEPQDVILPSRLHDLGTQNDENYDDDDEGDPDEYEEFLKSKSGK